jgi:hypothetical protein
VFISAVDESVPSFGFQVSGLKSQEPSRPDGQSNRSKRSKQRN